MLMEKLLLKARYRVGHPLSDYFWLTLYATQLSGQLCEICSRQKEHPNQRQQNVGMRADRSHCIWICKHINIK